jgi:hypothetical protein
MRISPIQSVNYFTRPKEICVSNHDKPSLSFNDYPPAPTETLKAYNCVSFEGYNCELKKLYKKGLVKIEWSFYGGKLNPKKFSVEHVIPKSKGGMSNQKNYVFCNRDQNSYRGNDPLQYYIDWDAAAKYLEQFRDIKVNDFDGNKYINDILESIRKAIARGV